MGDAPHSQQSTESDQIAVVVDHLTKVFKGGVGRKSVLAVHDVSFTVKVGEVYGLIGPNGSGKSTTMKAMLGLLKPTQGRAAIFGRESTTVASRTDVGFLPENPYFYKHLSGRETLYFYGHLCGMKGAALKARTTELLELVGLTHAATQRVGGYSKGMLQRIGLAQALVHDPQLLILDEPTAGVDPNGSRKIRDLILRLKERGMTVVVTSHLLEQIQEVCDRVGMMSNGKMVLEGKVSDLISVESQTEILLEHASPELLAKIEDLLRGEAATKLIKIGRPRTTLERLFLEHTAQSGDGE